MGLLDDLGGALGGALGAANGQAAGQEGGLAGLIGGLLQGGVGAQGGQLVSALLGGGGANMGQTLETLAANGLGEQVSSWLSQNPNLPVSADQIRAALGNEQVTQMANATGLPVGDFLQHLAEHLPAAAAATQNT
jgi:uncharacterized protein YidB (DUF937 family)